MGEVHINPVGVQHMQADLLLTTGNAKYVKVVKELELKVLNHFSGQTPEP
ncbi:MAG: hypothetical protein H7X83_05525 [Verrucomicrobia bacterium]|nr:hypothetical protein [Deltaproteobacteria bacterium]